MQRLLTTTLTAFASRPTRRGQWRPAYSGAHLTLALPETRDRAAGAVSHHRVARDTWDHGAWDAHLCWASRPQSRICLSYTAASSAQTPAIVSDLDHLMKRRRMASSCSCPCGAACGTTGHANHHLHHRQRQQQHGCGVASAGALGGSTRSTLPDQHLHLETGSVPRRAAYA